ncbi:conserved hypothetical protein [Leishmania major strain Friedlin]|uniref:Crossover junction endonuclease MUS81 n=1 Tax=Leishmania major TaxID=5664 RepID=Q4QAH9_LEIMA|nr:conserved hypothetical protein [Leishmania major strain Friedlin]CAG9574625.1 SAP_domain/ERCC4_domain_containing_protein_-_putative [Leishmania major strain Friedlin]CAJ05094.1 conserved hypothetical protein [Leishmania major strain Friedlin]|eukprot:XP_001683669.1 conserved hypothetical protein [Leishmania major strain Friedlin]
MAEPQSRAPAPLCAGATDIVVAASAGISVNARLCKHLLLQGSSLTQPQPLTNSVFLDALARYPLPVVSAATAHDVAGSEQQLQLHQPSAHSPLQPPSEASSEPTTAASAAPVRIRRSTASPLGERHMSFRGAAPHAASDLTSAINQFWALSPAPAAPHSPLLATTEGDAQGPVHTAAVAPCGSAPQPTPPPPPPWVAFSPFRFCADPSFHAALQRLSRHRSGTADTHQRRQRAVAPPSPPSRHMPGLSSLGPPVGGVAPASRPAGEGPHGTPSSGSAAVAVNVSAPDGGSVSFDAPLGAPWTVMDAWCHGFAATAVDGGRSRKRARTASATAASPTSAEPTTFARLHVSDTYHGGSARMGSKNSPPPTVTTVAAHDTFRTNPSPDSIATLLPWASPKTPHETVDVPQSRVPEKDDLLDLLLGVRQNASRSPEFAGGLPCSRAQLMEATGMTGAEVHTEGEGERNALAKHNGSAMLSSSRTVSRLGTSAARAGADGLATSCVQRNQATTSLALTAAATATAMPRGPALSASADADFSCGAVDPNNGEHVLVSTVRELRSTCARLGLLSTGSKTTLQQRLRFYYASAPASQQSGVRVPLAATAANLSAALHVPLDPGATRTGGEVGASRSTGSPPRTVFRYHSPSQSPGSVLPASAAAVAVGQPRTCATEAVSGPATRVAGPAVWEHAAVSTSPAAAASGQRGRFVPSPTQFLHDLASWTTRTPHTALATLCDAHSPPSATAARAQQEELTSETGRVRWQWLVDFRERSSAHRGGGGSGRRQHEGMLDVFRKQHVPCTSMMLPAGDFMLSVELSNEEAAAMHVYGVAASTEVDPGVPSASAPAEGAAPVLSHVCSLVVERKTAADLDASVKGARYTEQRRLLAASPFRLVVWLIEGVNVAGGSGSGFSRHGQRHYQGGDGTESDTQPGSRSPSPAPSSRAESARQRVDSACASLGLHGKGWLVVRTRNTTESVQFLKLLATHVARQLASYRLRRRCMGEGNSGMVAGTDGCAACQTAAQDPSAQRVARADGGDVHCGNIFRSTGNGASTTSMAAAVALLQLTTTKTCLQSVSALQRHLRAKTAFPRMLMCVRGCSAALASLLSSKYGTLLRFWRELRRRGQEVCDADPDIQRLTTAQKKVYILLTEFLLAKDYF